MVPCDFERRRSKWGEVDLTVFRLTVCGRRGRARRNIKTRPRDPGAAPIFKRDIIMHVCCHAQRIPPNRPRSSASSEPLTHAPVGALRTQYGLHRIPDRRRQPGTEAEGLCVQGSSLTRAFCASANRHVADGGAGALCLLVRRTSPPAALGFHHTRTRTRSPQRIDMAHAAQCTSRSHPRRSSARARRTRSRARLDPQRPTS
eukprot:6953889-Prymnesium_polylepis.2